MKTTYGLIAAMVVLSCGWARAATVLFDFNNGPQYSSLPLDLTVDGVTAHFSATGQGFSIQNTAQVIGVLPAGFSSLGLVPNSVYLADLLVSFPQTTLTDFSIMFAPQDLDTDTSATLKLTASMNNVFVGMSTAVSDYQGIWPSGTLRFSSPQGFNNVVVHYFKPPTGGDYGVIFAADNMNVTPMVLSGDFNQDSTVDAADYVVWRKELSTTYTPTDYDVWRSNFGGTLGVGAGGDANDAVPEPATLVLLILLSARFYTWRRARFHLSEVWMNWAIRRQTYPLRKASENALQLTV